MADQRHLTAGLAAALRKAGVTTTHDRELRNRIAARCQLKLPGRTALAKLHSALVDRSSARDIVNCAIEAARFGQAARPRPYQLKYIHDAIIAAAIALRSQTLDAPHATNIVLALSCLSSHSHEARTHVSWLIAQVLAARNLDVDWLRQLPENALQRDLMARALRYSFIAGSIRSIHDERKQQIELERLQAQERARATERAKRRLLIEDRLMDAKRALLTTAAPTQLPLPGLRETDLRLILAWSGVSASRETTTTKCVRNALSTTDLARLWSARTAELVVQEYFRQREKRFTDISLTQLQPGDCDWKTHDICTGPLLVDVKNARQSFSDPARYSEYLVPRFKEERTFRQHVTVAAVLSPYKTAARIEETFGELSTLVGFVTKEELVSLTQWLQSRFAETLTVSNLSSGGRLPGWCFDYDQHHYSGRGIAKRLASEAAVLLTESPDLQNDISFPKPLLHLIDDQHLATALLRADGRGGDRSSDEEETGSEIRALSRSIGLSRRTLFAFVIAYTLQRLRESRGTWSPELFYDWIFLDRDEESLTRPLGLDDPLRFISSIVFAMSRLWDIGPKSLAHFSSFRLASPWILRGTAPDGVEQTIMAYCGGWRELSIETAVKCGLSPLVLGLDEPCTSCGRLVCRQCRFCSKECRGPDLN